jgi:Zn-dependent protease
LITCLAVIAHSFGHVLVSCWFRTPIRDVSIHPFWGIPRFGTMAEHPWREVYIALVGPLVYISLAASVAAWLIFDERSLRFHIERNPATFDHFSIYAFWSYVLLIVLNFLPFAPLDTGMMFRAILAKSVGRIRACESAATLTTIGAGMLAVVAILYLKSPLVFAIGVLLYLGSQEELGIARYFDSIRREKLDKDSVLSNPPNKGINIPLDELVGDIERPSESDFTGFVWSPKSRMWIEWRDGKAIAANALIGD